PAAAPHLHLPRAAYRSRLPDTLVLAPHLDARARGHVTVDGERHELREALSVRLRRGPVVLPRLTMLSLTLDGETLSFREPWELPLARAEWTTGRYALSAAGATARVEIELTCRPED